MDEQFETRPLLQLDTLRALQQRADLPSLVRLSLHLAAFVALFALVMRVAHSFVPALVLSLLLAWVWSGLFAPFHECVHGTAFRTRRGNTVGAWLAGIPFMMAPAVYRTFHFEHHRHTQDVDKDPELSGDPRYRHWPTGLGNWLHMATGIGLIKLKLRPLFGFSLKPEDEWEQFARWAPHISDRPGLVQECRIVLGLWTVFVVSAVLWLPGGWWLLFAAWFAHVFQTLWVASEHTGLPADGSILRRTRTVESMPLVRWWLWNMNYHAEHHAWPSIPWHRLPAAHAEVADQLESYVPGYLPLHRNIIAARNTPSCDPS